MGDKQEPNKIQECFRAIVAEIRAVERVLRKGPASASAKAAASVPGDVASGLNVTNAGVAAQDPATDAAVPVAGTGTRAARALSLRS